MIKFQKNPVSGDDAYLDTDRDIFYGWIVGGITWPSENPAAVVVVGQVDVWRPPRPVYILAEFEESNLSDLIKRCSFLSRQYWAEDFYGRPDPVCLRYIDTFNSEARQNRMKRFNFISAPSCDLPMDYHYNILRDRLSPGSKSIHFAEGSQIKGQLLAVPDGQIVSEDSNYPIVSALAYAVTSLAEAEIISENRPKFAKHSYNVLDYDD